MKTLLIVLSLLLITACGGPSLPAQTHTCTGTLGTDSVAYTNKVYDSGRATASCTVGSAPTGGSSFSVPSDAIRYSLMCISGTYAIRFKDGVGKVYTVDTTNELTTLTCN